MSRATTSMSKIWLRGRRSAAGLLKDRSGIAATEFAVIVPMMLVMFFGTIEFSVGVAIDRKVTLIARTLSDLTSQAAVVNDNDFNTFFGIAGQMMAPYSQPTYPLPNGTISELYIDPATGVARVQWSQGSAPRAVSSPVVIPTALIGKDSNGKIIQNQYLIFSEVNFLYTPTIGYVLKSSITMSDVAYTRPRQSTCVFYPAAPAVVPPATQPACPTS